MAPPWAGTRKAGGRATRVVSGIQPTGRLHVGNLWGALAQFARLQEEADCYFAIADLHALTSPRGASGLRVDTLATANLFLAAGVRPERATVFVQSQVPHHTWLAWILGCLAHMGELERMTQFKQKGTGAAAAALGLFTYPVLMAADVLLYGATHVPVGEDQTQHLELARRLARRCNAAFGTSFPLPRPLLPPAGARIMALDDPRRKMSKSEGGEAGRIAILDPPDAVRAKVRAAVTDSGGEVRFDAEARPAVSNLLTLFSLFTGEPAAAIAARYSGYERLKRDLAEAIVAGLEPIQRRYDELARDPAFTLRVLAGGAERARGVAEATVAEVRERVGLLAGPPAEPPPRDPGER